MSKLSFSSLRSRAIILVLLAILPLLALTLYSYFDQRDSAIREVQRDELVAVRNMATVQETLFNETGVMLTALARMAEVQRQDRDACNLLFAELLKKAPHSTTIVAADSEGRAFASAPAPPGPVNYSDRPWFKEVKQVRNLVFGETVKGRVSGKYGSNLAFPILDREGRFLGALTTQLDMDWLQGLLAKSDFPPTTATVLSDASRKVVFRYPDPLQYIGKPLPEPILKLMTKKNEGVAAGEGLPGDTRVFAFCRMSPPWQDLWVSIGIPREWAVAPVNRTLWRNLIWLTLVALFAMAAAWYGGKWFVVRPVRNLRRVTDRLAAGDLAVRAGSTGAVGELGLLAQSFDQMADSLQERQEALRQLNEELEGRVAERTGELKESLTQLKSEMAERQRAEKSLLLSNRVLEIVNRYDKLPTLLKESVAEIKAFFDFEAVGIRILDEEGNIPYHGYVGFSKEFYEMESPLTIKTDQCMCINVIKGVTDPRMPFYTPGGSFFMNGTTRFLAGVSPGDKGSTRNVCNATGYESVALVPIRLGEKILGLIHLADRREDVVPRVRVELMEKVALQLGAALQRARTQEQITELNEELEQRVKERTAELERSNRELEQFAFLSSHDMQEPLRQIANYSEILTKDYQDRLDEKGLRYFGYITSGAKRMQALINDLLAYSRVDQSEIPQTLTNLVTVLKRAIHNLNPLIEESGAGISHEPLPALRINANLIGQVLVNLISNAIKFRNQQPPRIHLSARQEDGHWLISVKDNGIGFNPRYADRLFQLFKRMHSQEKFPGTGIGLAICKKIVEKHGGRIWAESEPGHGATFHFTIPV